jgi:hypothetical protein
MRFSFFLTLFAMQAVFLTFICQAFCAQLDSSDLLSDPTFQGNSQNTAPNSPPTPKKAWPPQATSGKRAKKATKLNRSLSSDSDDPDLGTPTFVDPSDDPSSSPSPPEPDDLGDPIGPFEPSDGSQLLTPEDQTAENENIDNQQPITRFEKRPELHETQAALTTTELSGQIEPLDLYTHGVFLSVGFIENEGSFLTGTGLGYETRISEEVWYHDADYQDSLHLELGAFYYSAINFKIAGDGYEVLALFVNVKYKVHINSFCAVYGLLEITRNQAFKWVNDATPSALNSFFGGPGVGVQLQFGPGWFGRAQAAITILSAGIGMRF